MQTIAVANFKGGVGKTTTVVNLAGILAEMGRRCLVVDLDPQGNATTWIRRPDSDTTGDLYGALVENGDLQGLVETSLVPGVDLVAAGERLSLAEQGLVTKLARESILKRKLSGISGYDYVFLDCAPGRGLLLVTNALVAARMLLVPVQPDYFSLSGITQFSAAVAEVQEALNPTLATLGILFVLVNESRILDGQVIDQIRERYGELVFGAMIRNNIKLSEAISAGKIISAHAPGCHGDEDYTSLAREVEGRIHG